MPSAGDLVEAGQLRVMVGAARKERAATSTSPTEAETADAKTTEAETSSPSRVVVRTFGAATARRIGGIGLAVRLARADGGAKAGKLTVGLDYSGFRDAFGGGFAGRLTLIEQPACVLEDKPSAECLERAAATWRRVPVVNDVAKGVLTAVVEAAPAAEPSAKPSAEPSESAEPSAEPSESPTPSEPEESSSEPGDPITTGEPSETAEGSGTAVRTASTRLARFGKSAGRHVPTRAALAATSDGSVYALSSSSSGSSPDAATGSFAATDLKPSGTWQVGQSGGEFSYSYPIPVPPAVSGADPSLELSYSSSSVDGLTGYTNNQAPWVGMGWDLGVGFIERRFRPCSTDIEGTGSSSNTNQDEWKHLCWESPDENDGDSATTDMTNSQLVLSVAGKSSPIVKDRLSGAWKTVDDFGWKIEYLTSGAESGQPYWKVTTQDGTVYRLGYRRESSLQVPYLGDDTGEPCHNKFPTSQTADVDQNPGAFCTAPWRWSLDQQVDAKKNVTDYFYTREQNTYCINAPLACSYFTQYRLAYDRGGYLARVEYGRNSGVAGSVATARVVLTAVDRGQPPQTGMSWYDDKPEDLDNGTSPAFYISNRLDKIVTSTLNTSGGWDDVMRLELGYKWIQPPYSTFMPVPQVLWLDTIRQVGLAGTGPDIALPPVDFEAQLLDNRADYNGDKRARLSLPRINSILNGMGGRIDVTYGQANPCAAPGTSPYPAPDEDENTKDCYWQDLGYYSSGDYSEWLGATWMKYLVTQVVEKDLVAGSPDQVTRYEYLGTPAWARAFDYNKVAQVCLPACGEDWDQWRGYLTVRTLEGNGSDPADYSVTSSSFFRGMYDDVLFNGTPKHTTVTDFDGNTYNDLRILAGRPLHERTWQMTTYSATPSQRVYEEAASTRSEYQTTATGDGPGIFNPTRIDHTRQVDREKVTSGWRYTEAATEYNADGLPIKVNDYGEQGVAADNTCTSTSYAKNTSGGAWMIDYPASEERRAGDDCTSGTFMGRTVTLYDGATSEAANTPTAGNATEIRTYTSTSGFTTAKATYDGYGRTLTATDPLGKTHSTAYSPAVGWPTGGVTVTNPLGHTVTTWASAPHGQPVGTRDANNRDVNIDYDALGRTIALWTPAQPKSGGTAAATVTYTIPVDASGAVNGPVLTATSRLQSGTGSSAKYVTTYSYDDGLGRTRETQTASPSGGRVVTVQTYDARGLDAATGAPAYNTAQPGSGLLYPALTSLPQWSKPVYDGLERVIADVGMSGSTELRRTTTAYFGDRTEVTPPVGGKTVSHIDVDDQVTKVEEWKDATTHHDTTYEYDRDGNLTKQTDANGNVRTFTYDLLGRRIAAHDPDAGDSEQGYDAAGRMVWSTNGKGQKVSTTYDDLGRKKAVWAGEAGSGTKLAEWVYDTLLKGKLTSATRYTAGQPYTDAVTAYDVMGRPTGSSLTIPSSEGLLAGTYAFTTGYTATGAVAEYGMPAGGGLAAEKVTSTYTDLGLAQGLTSDLASGFTYVKSTGYTATGLLSEREYGATGKIKRTLAWDPANRWLDRITTTTNADSSPVVAQDDQYSYDASGEITRILDAASATGGSPGQSECFTYDGLHRLATAFTTTASSCGAGADNLGSAPYNQAYVYDGVGNMTSLTDAGQTATYGYPAAGASAVRPNAVTSITRTAGTDSYGYDNAGQLTTRTAGGKQGSFTWNEIGQLEKATIDGADTTMVYDADGERLIRRDPGGKATLFLGSMEIETTGSSITGKRYYTSPDGATVAMRTSGSGLTWLMSGLHGSEQLAVNDTTGTVSRERYLPFGQRRGSDDLPFTDRGFLGKIEDDSTGLTYLSARYYDPAIAKFTTTDPLLNLQIPQWANPYSYSANNPIGLSDATGLEPRPWHDPDWNKKSAKQRRKITKRYMAGERKAQREFNARERDKALHALAGDKKGAWAPNPKDLENHKKYGCSSPPCDSGEAVPAGILGEGEDVDAVAVVIAITIATEGLAAEGAALVGGAATGGRVAATEGGLLRPGPWAKRSIPARGKEQKFTPEERNSINKFGKEDGCHSCGATNPGTKKGNFIPDHQPVSRTVPDGTPQRLYPHCRKCSNDQGLYIIQLIRKGYIS